MMKRLLVFLALLAVGPAQAWHERGGDAVANDFKATAYTLSKDFRRFSRFLPDYFLLSEFDAALERTELSSSPEVWLRNVEKDAVNIPDVNPPQIIISRTRWIEILHLQKLKEYIVLHEYLSIMGIDDSNYKFSVELMRILEVARDHQAA